MNNVNAKSNVQKQYQNANNLNTRISIHEKYSTNKMGFGNWIFSNYNLLAGAKVLELGCGTATIWSGRNKEIGNCKMILSDLSEGMLEVARKNLFDIPNIEYKIIDIQDIPYEDNSFDIVIANMMLYHVPNINKALKEVRRVLRKGGVFYTATYGENGIVDYLAKLCGVENNTNKNFTLQNGKIILNKVFDSINRLDYKDSLAVTNINDIIDYIYSLTSMSSLSLLDREKLKTILSNNMENGVLNIPKEYGMFICK